MSQILLLAAWAARSNNLQIGSISALGLAWDGVAEDGFAVFAVHLGDEVEADAPQVKIDNTTVTQTKS